MLGHGPGGFDCLARELVGIRVRIEMNSCRGQDHYGFSAGLSRRVSRCNAPDNPNRYQTFHCICCMPRERQYCRDLFAGSLTLCKYGIYLIKRLSEMYMLELIINRRNQPAMSSTIKPESHPYFPFISFFISKANGSSSAITLPVPSKFCEPTLKETLLLRMMFCTQCARSPPSDIT